MPRKSTKTVDPYEPVLDGDKYCSPRCGCGCLKSDYTEAVRQAHATAKELGPDWQPVVWENGGWHWKVANGKCEIYKLDNHRFWATLEIGKDQYEFGDDYGSAKGALRRLKQKLAVISREMRTLIQTL